jgi:hypothetical protein
MPTLPWVDLAITFLGVLLLVWNALYLPRRYRGATRSTDWPPTIRWLWRIAWTATVLGAVAFAVLRIRHPAGTQVVLPASARLIDHVLQVSLIAFGVGYRAALMAWKVALSAHERRVRRQEDGL